MSKSERLTGGYVKIEEGYVKKGGLNPNPSTQRPPDPKPMKPSSLRPVGTNKAQK